MKGIVIAGTRSGIGKTTISMGLMSVFEDVQPFKVGPDYIDTTFHRFVTGNKSYNLDIYLMGESGVKYSFYKNRGAISIVEGVMGLYDGLGTSLENYSTAHISKLLKLPVILVVDGQKIGMSIAGEVLGYKLLDKDVDIKGIIINRVSSEKVYVLLKESIEKYTDIECLGYLKNDERFTISSRHLGLLMADEVERLEEKKKLLREEIGKTIDIERILEIAEIGEREKFENPFEDLKDRYKGLKVGVARDRAFNFYYEDSLELLEYMGAELIEFSPLLDKSVPKADILYFGGGYPENYLKELSENKEFIDSLKNYHNERGYIYAECGGFMYMTKGIRNLSGKSYEMASLLDCSIKMTERLMITRFGYVEVECGELKGRGHEFHYSTLEEEREKTIFRILKNDGREWRCGYRNKNLIAGYPHLHLFGNIEFLEKLFRKI